jgi:acyl dehydratase
MTKDLRDRTFADLKEGEELKALHIDVTREHIADFQIFLGHYDKEGAFAPTHDKENFHVDDDFAARNIYGSVVGDGNQTFQYMIQVVTDSLPWGSLLSGYSELDVKFTNPTRIGDKVVTKGKIVQKLTEGGRNYALCEMTAHKQGDVLVGIGTIKAYVPG